MHKPGNNDEKIIAALGCVFLEELVYLLEGTAVQKPCEPLLLKVYQPFNQMRLIFFHLYQNIDSSSVLKRLDEIQHILHGLFLDFTTTYR